jgi:hypothetical protein
MRVSCGTAARNVTLCGGRRAVAGRQTNCLVSWLYNVAIPATVIALLISRNVLIHLPIFNESTGLFPLRNFPMFTDLLSFTIYLTTSHLAQELQRTVITVHVVK